jgi:hypothetical protein
LEVPLSRLHQISFERLKEFIDRFFIAAEFPVNIDRVWSGSQNCADCFGILEEIRNHQFPIPKVYAFVGNVRFKSPNV